ncbi:MAG: hypothetical protein KJ884_15545 [Gammaproteobacteria bacterium]|nr:hypothetical protein [Gammaproteobacteria bacterium]MBU1489945.1 hypothetical protein [Gammaproteobacteria bacterium]MBU2064880.1 hypothetical protein [Gammaproteobacteria bacterium]MBU2324364.1 hypothetical protein [Gammaproteobacteria bacterium]
MDCLIIYSRAGERRVRPLRTKRLPNLKAVEFAVISAELPEGLPDFSQNDAPTLGQLLAQLDIQIIDVQPVQSK